MKIISYLSIVYAVYLFFAFVIGNINFKSNVSDINSTGDTLKTNIIDTINYYSEPSFEIKLENLSNK